MRVEDGFSALTCLGLDQMLGTDLIFVADDAICRWRGRFADGAESLVRIEGRKLGVYCTCGVCPCGHRAAAIEVALAEDAGMQDAINAVAASYAIARSPDMTASEREDRVKEASSALTFSTLQYGQSLEINLDDARLQRESGVPILGGARQSAGSSPRSISEAMNRR